MMYPGYVNMNIKHNQIIQEKNIFIYDLLMGQVEYYEEETFEVLERFRNETVNIPKQFVLNVMETSQQQAQE